VTSVAVPGLPARGAAARSESDGNSDGNLTLSAPFFRRIQMSQRQVTGDLTAFESPFRVRAFGPSGRPTGHRSGAGEGCKYLSSRERIVEDGVGRRTPHRRGARSNPLLRSVHTRYRANALMRTRATPAIVARELLVLLLKKDVAKSARDRSALFRPASADLKVGATG